MTQAQLVAQVQLETAIRALSSELTADDYSNAYSKALNDLGITSSTTAFIDDWMVRRMKRWLLQFRMEVVTENFDVPKAKLQQVFDNYEKLIKGMDNEFEKAKSDTPDLFGLCSLSDAFGSTISSGFLNDSLTGEDLTYEVDHGVLINGS
jgi:hypothetical protein